MKVGEQKFVLGTLSREKIPQISLELVLEKEFELSHNSKNASVHFCGYKAFYDAGDEYPCQLLIVVKTNILMSHVYLELYTNELLQTEIC